MEQEYEQNNIVGKKINFFNIFAFVMVAVMCVVSVVFSYMAASKNKDGMSSYELAIKNGVISEDMTELEYLQSLYGEDGKDVTLEDIYYAYLDETNKTEAELTYQEFILTYYPDKILDEEETLSLIEATTTSALRSTVDICYSYYMNSSIIYVSESNGYYYLDSSYSDRYCAIGVSAGSGVIYYMDDETAYIITNYHVVYCSNYSNSEDYYVYYNETTDEYFTAEYNANEWTTKTTTSMPWGQMTTSKVIAVQDLEEAPLNTHFLTSYGVYLYGYQYSKYEISATFVGGSSDNDIAVLKVSKSDSKNNELLFNGSYKAAALGDSSNLNEGKTIVAVGNPLLVSSSSTDDSETVSEYVGNIKQSYIDALCLTSTSGEVSLVSENCDFTSIVDSSVTISMRLIRVSAAINAGNSGGGLYDASGRLVGIVNGKIADEDYDNVGYAIPVNVAVSVANQIIYQCDGTNIAIKALTASSLGITLADNEIAGSYYDPNSLLWVTDNQVVISEVSGFASNNFATNDVINQITINATDGTSVTYNLNFNYDLDDILLNVLSGKTTSITFNVTRAETQVELTFLVGELAEYFVSII